MNLRALLAAVTLLPAGMAFAAEGDPCNPETFTTTCDADNIILCGAANQGDPNTELHLDCTSEFYSSGGGQALIEPTFTCAAPACTGTACTNTPSCIGEAAEGAACQGAIGVIGGGQDALIIPCAAGFSCNVTQDGEACTATTSTCTASGASCDGTVLKLCFGGADATFTDPATLDCALVGGECRTEGQFTGCFVAEQGLCATNGFVAVCEEGLDCSPDQAGAAFGTCTTPSTGEGEGEGEGEVGGEGEGEGNDRDDQAELPPSAGCALNAFGALPAFGPLALALLALRRRRR
jgi:hypothetical protein